MVKMFNTITHTEMYVADDRVAEYQAMGHRVMEGTVIAELAKDAVKEIPKKQPTIEETTKKLKATIARTKKTTRKKA